MKRCAMIFAICVLTSTTFAKTAKKGKEGKEARDPSSIGDCAYKIKTFAEEFASKYLDIEPAGQYTRTETSPDRIFSTVKMTDSSGGRIRTLIVKLGAGRCSIVGVESPDMALE